MYFFDLDGTLLDSNGIWLDIDIEFLGRRGISPVPEDYTDYVTHHSAPDAARYTRERFSLPETPEEIMEGWMSMARSAYAHTLPLKPGVPANEETKDILMTYIRKNVAKYALPYDIEFRAELPKTLVGKVAYRVLEEEELKKLSETAQEQ